jgi:hypothetical protein
MTKRSPSKTQSFDGYVIVNEYDDVLESCIFDTLDRAKDAALDIEGQDELKICGLTPLYVGIFTGREWKEV